jgi:hypothetical protein
MTHSVGRPPASVEAVEKERAILERLERIDGLREEDAPAGVLLDEVRALLSEAESWVRQEPVAPERVVDALERSQAALAAGESRTTKLLLGR